MALRSDSGARAAVDPTRWLTRLASVTATEPSAALDEIAQRIHEVFPVDLVTVEVADENDPSEIVRGYCVGSSAAAQALAPLLSSQGLDPIALGHAAREAHGPVAWPRIASEPAQLTRLATLADGGGPAGALHRALLDAGGVAVPIGVPGHPALGALALVSLSRESPVPPEAAAELAALAPQIALTVRNQQLAALSRRNRQTLEGVIASSRMGIIVSDMRGRLSLANRAASQIIGIDLQELVGRPMPELIGERIKWRFINPEEYAERVLAVHADPTREATGSAVTVDGRSIEHTSAPVRGPDGALVGRVDILHDVSAARTALADARRLATERAALLEREERRAQAEVALSRAAHLMASALTPDEIHGHLLDQAHALVHGCEKSAVLTVDGRGDVRPAAARGFAEASIKRMTFRSGEGTVGRLMVDRRPLVCNDTAVDDRLSTRITEPEGIRSFMLVPLVHGDRVLGLVSLNCLSPREFGERDVRLVSELARYAAGALHNALQFEQERHIAETLQQALIADRLPEVAGLQLAALYQAAAGSLVGGDFYSAWTLADGRLVLLVGDVSGKGVEAAGLTAMVRYTAEALSLHRSEPAHLVGELNDMLHPRLPDGALVTLVLAVVDIEHDELRWCSAGHPPPILMDAGGGRRSLDDPDPPCGVFPGQRFHQSTEAFDPGDLLMLYTDGLIEARRQGREFGEVRLREAIGAAAGEEPAELVRSVYAAVRTWCGGRLTDDVAVAAVKRAA